MIEQEHKTDKNGPTIYFVRPVFAVAPMIDWTDRHYRFLARQLSKHALLYTEMIVADAVLRGNQRRLLDFDPLEQPVALQLGGSNPEKLAEAARIGADFGYSEINMNVGCPSDRVQSGTFGACLMRNPALVAECVSAMKAAVCIPITVKCRIGVDDQDPQIALRELIFSVRQAGADAVWVHARKAWLKGLSPKENREIPPLDYNLVHQVKQENPSFFIGLNGGINALTDALAQLSHVDGVMLGRAAYHNSTLLTEVDGWFPHPLNSQLNMTRGPVEHLGPDVNGKPSMFWADLRDAMMAHASQHIARGGRLIHVTRHMIGLFQGWPGARRYRQILSHEATGADAGPDIISQAFDAVFEAVNERQTAE